MDNTRKNTNQQAAGMDELKRLARELERISDTSVSRMMQTDRRIMMEAAQTLLAKAQQPSDAERIAWMEAGAARQREEDAVKRQPSETAIQKALFPFAKAYMEWGGGNAPEHFAAAVCPADFRRAYEAMRSLLRPAAQEAEKPQESAKPTFEELAKAYKLVHGPEKAHAMRWFMLGQKYAQEAAREQPAAPQPPAQEDRIELTVWEGPMPESNGRSNFTAVLCRKSDKGFDRFADGFTIARSEYPDRVRYEADRVRYLIGEIDKRPRIIDYDADKHSGYVAPPSPQEDRITQLEAEIARIKACFHANMLRAFPSKSHKEIQAEIDAAITAGRKG